MGGRGGEQVGYLALWDLDSSQSAYRLDFGANVSAVSIDEFRLDTFVQSTAFVTPSAVPEPGSFVALAIAGSGSVDATSTSIARQRVNAFLN